MKKIYCFAGMLLCFSHSLFSQSRLVFKGTVKCYISDDERSTRGAKNVIVVPGFVPQKSGITGSQGYYEINTGAPIHDLEDKYVSVYYISSCKQCEKKVNVFVSSDQARENPDHTLSSITIPTLKMNAGCKNTELAPVESDRVLNNFTSQPGEDLSKVSALNVVTAPPGLLNLLSEAVTVAPVVNSGIFRVDPKIPFKGNLKQFGAFLFTSPMSLTANTGFNFSPYRDRSEAVFWNPSALANSTHANSVNAFTNFKNNVKLSGSTRINDRVTIGLGGIYTHQDAFQDVVYLNQGNSVTTSHLQTLAEYAVFLSGAYKVNKKFSAGLTIKSIWQRFNLPDRLQLSQNPVTNTFFDSTINKQQFDADISFSYNITPALKAGVNIMNIAAAELHSATFALLPGRVPFGQLRSLGLGLCYRWRQFNAGTDALITAGGLYDISLGVNYVPFNTALLSAGYVFKQRSFSASFKWKYFRTSYVDDNGLMVNEKRPGKSKIFNGHIYTGIVLDF